MKTETKRSNKEGSGVDFTTQFKIFNERFSIPATRWLTQVSINLAKARKKRLYSRSALTITEHNLL